MFRGVHYVTLDYMLYIQDGWITFAYWKPQYVYEKIKVASTKPTSASDPKGESINLMSMGSATSPTTASAAQADTDSKSKKPSVTKLQVSKRTARLNIFLCNFQLHYYNSWKLNTLSKQMSEENKTNAKSGFLQSNSLMNFISSNFNLASLSLNANASAANADHPNGANEDEASVSAAATLHASAPQASDYNFTEDLMQLFSVVNIKIQKGKIFAGNSTLPSTLIVRLSSGKMELVTEKSQSKVDDYCFILRGDLNKLEFSLIANKKFQPAHEQINTEKKLENRILIFRCVSSDFEYVQDIPSILTFDRRFLKKNETGELIQDEKEPQWSLTLNCNKHTLINYGPWYDLQREALWKFFFPAAFEKAEPQPEPTLNERRQTSKFDVFVKFKDPNPTELNILFTSSLPEFPHGNGNPDKSGANFLSHERKIVIMKPFSKYFLTPF
jgi:hypothetical protein